MFPSLVISAGPRPRPPHKPNWSVQRRHLAGRGCDRKGVRLPGPRGPTGSPYHWRMATWQDGPEYAPRERPAAFVTPPVPPLVSPEPAVASVPESPDAEPSFTP